MATVYLGIGSNLGDRQGNIDAALNLLAEHSISAIQRSSIIETKPVGGPEGQANYFNAVLKAETSLPPEDLLCALKDIELKLGRTPTVRNGPRPIDLDILLYDQLQYQSELLTIPHPRMFERDFVMNPLKEIAAPLVETLTHAHS